MVQTKAKNMRVTVDGDLPLGVTAKDMVLAIIGAIGMPRAQARSSNLPGPLSGTSPWKAV